MTKSTANMLATQCGFDLGKEFFTLPLATVQKIIDAADLVKYRKPKNANGSRGRYFYAALNRAK